MNHFIATITLLTLALATLGASEGQFVKGLAGSRSVAPSNPIPTVPNWLQQRQTAAKVTSDGSLAATSSLACCPMLSAWQLSRRPVAKVDWRQGCCQTMPACCQRT